MKKYDLWWYSKLIKQWRKLNIESYNSLEKAELSLKIETESTLYQDFQTSLFKIAEHGDTSWMQHIPDYLLKK